MRIFGTLVLVCILVGCGQKPVSYQTQIQPILNKHCISCHNADRASGKIMLTSYENLMNARASAWKKPIVVPGNPSESWMYLSAGTSQPHFRMPPDTSNVAALPENEVILLGKWIQQGAKNN